jgi:excisionase family DNA binding protein
MKTDVTQEKQSVRKVLLFKAPDVLDVGMTARFLDVSADTVYTLFKDGVLPARKVGRKWKTTKASVLRWLESSATDDTLTRAVGRGDSQALADAINSGKIKVKSKAT